MIILGLLVIILVKCTPAFDIYFIRHGARSPLRVPVESEFKVSNAELTLAGKSQAYFFGKQLRLRHPNILDQQLIVYSAPKNRVLSTALYGIKGWYGLNQTDGEFPFLLDKKYLPPVNLSYLPQYSQMKVNENLYRQKIIILDKQVNEGSKCIKTNAQNKQEYLNILEKIPSNLYCQKIQKKYPKYCENDLNKGQKMRTILDLRNCLETYNKTIPLSKQEIQLIIDLKNNLQLTKFFNKKYQIAGTTKIIQLLIKTINARKKKLVLSFTHDGFLFTFLSVLIGNDNFLKLFTKKVNMPFLSILHIKIKNSKVTVFFNDKPLSLSPDIPEENGEVSEIQFFNHLKKYKMDYHMICNLSQRNHLRL